MLRPIRGLLGWLRSTAVWLLGHPISLGTVFVGLLGGSLAGLPAGDALYTYMWRDPGFCDDCHVHDYANDAWAVSEHGQLTTCHDCHRVPIRHYPKNLYLALFNRPTVPEDIPRPEVGVVICEQCHAAAGEREELTGPLPERLRGLVVKVDESPLHRLHLEAKSRVPEAYGGGKEGQHAPTGIVCLDCHGGLDLDVHRFTANSDGCEACHEGIRPEDESGRTLSCLDCHEQGFLGRSAHASAALIP